MIKIKPKSCYGVTFYDEYGNGVKLKDNFKAIECRDITRKVLFMSHYNHVHEQGGSYDIQEYKVFMEDTLEEVSMYADVHGAYRRSKYEGDALEYFVKDEWVEVVYK